LALLPPLIVIQLGTRPIVDNAQHDLQVFRAVHYFGKFTSERDAIDWINAHSYLTKPEDTMDEPQHAALQLGRLRYFGPIGWY
jgi:hypothetical protein